MTYPNYHSIFPARVIAAPVGDDFGRYRRRPIVNPARRTYIQPTWLLRPCQTKHFCLSDPPLRAGRTEYFPSDIDVVSHVMQLARFCGTVARWRSFPFPRENSIQTSPFAQKRSAAYRNAESYFSNPEQSVSLAKRQAVAESCAADANTARLRALRLAREASDRKAE